MVELDRTCLVYFKTVKVIADELPLVADNAAGAKLGECAVFGTCSISPTGIIDDGIPRFWHGSDLWKHVLRWMSNLFEGSRIWALGEYDSTEIEQLKHLGLLPSDFCFPDTRPFAYHVEVMIRVSEISSFPLNCQQGAGHFDGVRFAIFDRKCEPLDLYSNWLTLAKAGDKKALKSLGIELKDNVCPRGSVGWFSPYGDEDRDHALLYIVGSEPSDLIANLAHHLEMPLIIADNTEYELMRGDYKIMRTVV